ncbi:MAG TPA: ABC transporter ATP-binding protein [Devosiaceae bacterium]
MTNLLLRKVGKSFGAFEALKGLDLEVVSGELVALLGPSGCGKTTTLRLISGLEMPTEGQVLFDSRDMSGVEVQQRNVGMVFQRYVLFPHMSVERNVSFGLRVRGTPRDEIEQRVSEILKVVQLEEFRFRFPSQLSGGQMQRVAIARTLITNPSVLMMDEPLANLDTKLRGEMRTFIRSLQRRLKITTVFVTHDQVEAMELADRVAVMFSGRIAQYAAPQTIYHRPASVEVARFIGAPNLMEAKVVRNGGATAISTGFGTLEVGDVHDHADGASVTAMIRPEAVIVGPDEGAEAANVRRGRIAKVDFFGQAITYEIEIDGAILRADEMSNRQLKVDDPVQVRLERERIWVFPGGGHHGMQA